MLTHSHTVREEMEYWRRFRSLATDTKQERTRTAQTDDIADKELNDEDLAFVVGDSGPSRAEQAEQAPEQAPEEQAPDTFRGG